MSEKLRMDYLGAMYEDLKEQMVKQGAGNVSPTELLKCALELQRNHLIAEGVEALYEIKVNINTGIDE